MVNKQNNKWFMYIPLILVEFYLGFTILLYQFGPLNWKTENEGMFWTLLLLYHLAFILGYVFSIQKVKLKQGGELFSGIGRWGFRASIWGVIAICAICACIEYKNLTHADSYIPYELPKNFWNGLVNPAEQYYNKFSPEGYTSNKLVTILSACFSFIYVSIIPLLVVEWKRISVPQKICCFAIILFKVIIYVSVGTNKGIFDTMFHFVGILMILILLNIFHGTDAHIDKKTFIIVASFALLLVVFSFTYFTANISSRVSSPVDYALSMADNETESTGATEGELEEKKADSFSKRMYYSVSNYLTQGYYGMSLALDEEFTTTYGIGNSQFLMSNFKSIFGIDVKDRTYQHKITERWHEDQQWHSFYSYIANDVSFYGVILVMLLLGLFYGCICKDVIVNNSLIGKMLLPLFIVMFMYMPANNQIFTSMATCTAFLELSFLWLLAKIFRKKGSGHGK